MNCINTRFIHLSLDKDGGRHMYNLFVLGEQHQIHKSQARQAQRGYTT